MKSLLTRVSAGIVILSLGFFGMSFTPASSTSSRKAMKPIVVFWLNDQGSNSALNIPEATWAAQAAVGYINRSLGGINGRQLSMKTCFTDETPATATRCGNEAVAAHPDVIMSALNSFDPTDAAIANQAHIPFLVYNGSSETINAFRFTDDQLGPLIAAGILLKRRGLHSLTTLALNYPKVTKTTYPSLLK